MLIDNKNVEITNTYFYTHGLWRSHVYRRGEMLKNIPTTGSYKHGTYVMNIKTTDSS